MTREPLGEWSHQIGGFDRGWGSQRVNAIPTHELKQGERGYSWKSKEEQQGIET